MGNSQKLNTSNETFLYWSGPFGILVPNETEKVVAIDGKNTTWKNGFTSVIGDHPLLTESEYVKKYAIIENEQRYYFTKKYWTGPFGMRVLNSINAVPAESIEGLIYKNKNYSHELVKSASQKIIKENYEKYKKIYLSKFAYQKDGNYYYKNKSKNNFLFGCFISK